MDSLVKIAARDLNVSDNFAGKWVTLLDRSLPNLLLFHNHMELLPDWPQNSVLVSSVL